MEDLTTKISALEPTNILVFVGVDDESNVAIYELSASTAYFLAEDEESEIMTEEEFLSHTQPTYEDGELLFRGMEEVDPVEWLKDFITKQS